jgi:hypothetical protein
MVLQRGNFEIPAEFAFRPFAAQWVICQAELMDWGEVPERSIDSAPQKTANEDFIYSDSGFRQRRMVPDCDSVIARVEVSVSAKSATGMLAAARTASHHSHEIRLSRAAVPTSILRPHENPRNTTNLNGRAFKILVCHKPEFRRWWGLALKPGDIEKNAWLMRDEFFGLDERKWISDLLHFLNRWGLWSKDYGFSSDLGKRLPGFVVVAPEVMLQKWNAYKKALVNAETWLSTADPLTFRTMHKPPYFLVERLYCEDALKATITIDHLKKRRFGFCQRCGKIFEKEFKKEKNYCSDRCYGAAATKRCRDKKRDAVRNGENQNAESKGA